MVRGAMPQDDSFAWRRGDDPDLAEIASLVKASAAKFKGPALVELVAKLQKRVGEEVPAWAEESGWIATTRVVASRMTTPATPIPIEFGPIRTVSAKTGRPPPAAPNDLFHPRTVSYRFGTRDFLRVGEKSPTQEPLELKDVAPETQLTWILAGHPAEAELAVAAIQRELDVDHSRDKLSRFLEYWRNGPESFYQALDRTAGSKEAVFFYDSMLGEFVAKLAPELKKAKTLAEKHDRLHDAFLSLRQYRRFIEAASFALVSTGPFPVRLRDFDYSPVAGSAQVRDGVELLIASHKGDITKALDDLKAMLAARPMPEELWGQYDTPQIFTQWFQENAAKIRARIRAADRTTAKVDDATLAVRCRTKRREIEAKVRAVARACLKEQGVTGKK
jgi:hypothetical protein